MQNLIQKPAELLSENGELNQKGYAESPVLNYSRSKAAKKSRLKEWDYYLIYCDDFAIAMTVAKLSCLGLVSASFIDLQNAAERTKDVTVFLPFGKLKMPESSASGDVNLSGKKVSVSFRHTGSTRQLTMAMRNFDDNSDFTVNLELSEEPRDSMVIATPFQEDKKDFYYNQKIIGMKASGKVLYNNTTYTVYKENAFGLLDWGRGVWPRHVTWRWSAGQGTVNGNIFGFNLGYGFGDTSAATENMLFYNGIASKLDGITFHIPQNDKNEYEYMRPWTVTSSDQRFEMVFTPIIDRNAAVSTPIIATDQHQVFGRFTGKAVLDNGMVIELQDFLGFIERVKNKW